MGAVVGLVALLLLLEAAGAARAASSSPLLEPVQRTCEPVRVELCAGIGYNVTGYPNLVGHELQGDAEITLRTFAPLIQYGCSTRLLFFLCSVYVPMCTEKVLQPIGPCRKLCESVRSRCYPVLQSFGLPWPTGLQCNKFPLVNNHEQMCMDGPSDPESELDAVEEPTTLPPPPVRQPTQPFTQTSGCAHLARRESYIYVNRTSAYCAPRCEADVLFSKHDKRLAEVWLSIWAGLCFVSTLATVLSFLVDSARCRYPERPALFLALCLNLAAVGWGVRAAAGRTAVACHSLPHPTAAGFLSVSVLLSHDGLANANCAVVFLLLYYFGMAALVWWVILCASWFLCSARRVSHEVLVRYSSSSHLIAWGVPAAQTVAVLAFRLVDADELTGVCYVGSQNSRSLLIFVLLPHCVMLALALLFLVLGMLLSPKSKTPAVRPSTLYVPGGVGRGGRAAQPAADASKARTAAQHEALLVRVGVLCFLCAVPQACVVATLVYEFLGRDAWLRDKAAPSLWVFMVRLFMSLAAGVAAVSWVWSARTLKCWHLFLQHLVRTPRKLEPAAARGAAVPMKQLKSSIAASGPTMGSATSGDPSGRYLIAMQQQTLIVSAAPMPPAAGSLVTAASNAAPSQVGSAATGKFHHTHTHFHHHHHHPRRQKRTAADAAPNSLHSNVDNETIL